jgi:hypothetical protein
MDQNPIYIVICSKLIPNCLTKLQRNSNYAYKSEKSSIQNKRSTSLSLSKAEVAIPGQ